MVGRPIAASQCYITQCSKKVERKNQKKVEKVNKWRSANSKMYKEQKQRERESMKRLSNFNEACFPSIFRNNLLYE